VRRVVLAVAVVLLASGCGGNDEATPTDTGTTTTPSETVALKVYWLRDGKVWPALREVETHDPLNAAVDQLLAGPTKQERADLGLTTKVPTDRDSELPEAGLAQLVYTLTQFLPHSAEVDGVPYTRTDFEEYTPAILVESPLAFEEVTSPLRVTGTANTFEATFNYELTDTDGKIVDENFVTATSGTGTRGTFDFTTAPFTVPFDGVGELIVFELSAKDGSRINLVEIPLKMTKED